MNYQIYYYKNSRTNKIPVLDYVRKTPIKDKIKIAVYIIFLRNSDGRLDEPYSRYISSGIRELRIDFSRNRHRIFYIAVEGKNIILLHAFLKKTAKMPKQEFIRALNNFEDYKINKNIIKYEK
jgi:phage-related protein